MKPAANMPAKIMLIWYFCVRFTASLPAADGVPDGEQTGADDRQAQMPAQHRRQHDGGSVDGDPSAEAALEQEKRGPEQASFCRRNGVRGIRRRCKRPASGRLAERRRR